MDPTPVAFRFLRGLNGFCMDRRKCHSDLLQELDDWNGRRRNLRRADHQRCAPASGRRNIGVIMTICSARSDFAGSSVTYSSLPFGSIADSRLLLLSRGFVIAVVLIASTSASPANGAATPLDESVSSARSSAPPMRRPRVRRRRRQTSEHHLATVRIAIGDRSGCRPVRMRFNRIDPCRYEPRSRSLLSRGVGEIQAQLS